MDGPILVTGGRGRLARALARDGGDRIVALPRSELDIVSCASVAAAFERLRPSAVINAAAVSSVEIAEVDPGHARRVNAEAPGRLARHCAQASIPCIHISTDYVFGASTDRPWREQDEVSPVNVYGRTKAEGEKLVLQAGANACIVRVAWLFGDGEDFIARLLRSGGGAPVQVAKDQLGSPTPLPILTARLLQLAGRMRGQDRAIPPVLHLAGSPPVSRADWVAAAFDGLARAGLRPPHLRRVAMSTLPSSVSRPRCSALACERSIDVFGEGIDWRPMASCAETFVGGSS